MSPMPATPQKDARDDPAAESRLGWSIALGFFGLFLGFAAIIRLDAAAVARGSIAVSGSRQAVQHREGGTVSALHVREGAHVGAGQILVELAGGEVRAQERALAGQVIGYEAERARLLAERAGLARIAPPATFAALAPEDRVLANQALAQQAEELAARRGAIASQKQVLHQRSAQLDARIGGIALKIDSNRRQASLLGDERAGMEALSGKGFASVNRVRALQRAEASLGGERGDLAATAASAREQIGEMRTQALAIDTQNLQQVAQRLGEVEERLSDARPKWIAARKVLEDTRIRATATGQVVGLSVFTVGGVIAPGQKLLEIVPDARPLVIDVTIAPEDADDLYTGQKAEVRFSSLNERDLPVFEGSITRLSADSFTDERTSTRYFTGEVSVAPEALAAIRGLRGAARGLRPGLPVEVLVPLRKRTLLQYLFEPLSQALWRSGREH